MPGTRPFVISISGPGSGSGKTTVACALIQAVVRSGRSAGAIKFATAAGRVCEKTGKLCGCVSTGDGPVRVETDPRITGRPGKDSGQMAASGASPVWWVASAKECAVDAARDAVARFAGVDVLIAEGSGPARAGLSDLHILVSYGDGRPAKDSAREMTGRAAAIVVNLDGVDPGLHAAAIAAASADVPPGIPRFGMTAVRGPAAVRFAPALMEWVLGRLPVAERVA